MQSDAVKLFLKHREGSFTVMKNKEQEQTLLLKTAEPANVKVLWSEGEVILASLLSSCWQSETIIQVTRLQKKVLDFQVCALKLQYSFAGLSTMLCVLMDGSRFQNGKRAHKKPECEGNTSQRPWQKVSKVWDQAETKNYTVSVSTLKSADHQSTTTRRSSPHRAHPTLSN